jgi:hypothetical protein
MSQRFALLLLIATSLPFTGCSTPRSTSDSFLDGLDSQFDKMEEQMDRTEERMDQRMERLEEKERR